MILPGELSGPDLDMLADRLEEDGRPVDRQLLARAKSRGLVLTLTCFDLAQGGDVAWSAVMTLESGKKWTLEGWCGSDHESLGPVLDQVFEHMPAAS